MERSRSIEVRALCAVTGIASPTVTTIVSPSIPRAWLAALPRQSGLLLLSASTSNHTVWGA
jgi:hypothetical protein